MDALSDKRVRRALPPLSFQVLLKQFTSLFFFKCFYFFFIIAALIDSVPSLDGEDTLSAGNDLVLAVLAQYFRSPCLTTAGALAAKAAPQPNTHTVITSR